MSADEGICSPVQPLIAKAVTQSGNGEAEISSHGDATAEEIEEEEIEYYGIGYDNIENIQYYNKDGHHPVHLGDILNGRYEVVHKLGSGGFGLVWLCHDIITSKWRAVKIMTAEHSTEGREEKIYRHLLKKSCLKQLRRNHLLIPLERFWVTGPNGRHYCIVLPVLGPTASNWQMEVTIDNNGHITDDVKKVCAQVVQAVHFLHQSGVCHGDLKPENVMMEVEGLDKLSKAEVLKLLGKPETIEVETESGKPPAPRAPNYVVLPPGEFWWKKTTTSSAFIIDFGTSFLTGDPPDVNGMSLSYAPPEVIWEKTFQPGPHSDIWSLAATLYRMIYGETMFNGEHIGSSLKGIEYFLGGLPEPYRSVYFADWRAATGRPAPEPVEQADESKTQLINEHEWEEFPLKWQYYHLLERREQIVQETGYSDHFEADIGNEREYRPNIFSEDDLTDEERYKALKYKLDREDVLGVADLLRKMLCYDPAKRININEVIGHPWLSPYVRSSAMTRAIENRLQIEWLVGITSVSLVALFAYIFQLRSSNSSLGLR
ncbi:kinase-like protein [Xylaria cf. heliscus]|nr:kinase-like protein [Xylaria cf. heliscus]